MTTISNRIVKHACIVHVYHVCIVHTCYVCIVHALIIIEENV